MTDLKGDRLYVSLSANETRRRLKGYGFGVKKIRSDGKGRAVIIHTATGQHRDELHALFSDVISSNDERR
jgi:DNA transformation protein and related proteins